MLSMGTSNQFIIYKLRLVAIFHHPAFRFDVLTQITSPIEDFVWRATLIYSAPITHVLILVPIGMIKS